MEENKMPKERSVIAERVDSYLKLKNIDISEDEKESVINASYFWMQYNLDDVISDAIAGVTFEEAI
jgi:glutamyl/glutaminyl-tRNA synthetase